MSTTYQPKGSSLQSIAACIFMLSAYGGIVRFWDPAGTIFIPVFSISFVVALILGVLGYRQIKRVAFREGPFLFFLLLLTFSSFFSTAYSLFPAPTMRGEILLFSVLLFLFSNKVASTKLWSGVLFVGCGLLFLELYRVTGGQPIFSDDHATFLFRFSLLKKQLFDIPFYYPFWNAGLDARDFFATGALNTFILFSPLYAFFSAFSVHTTVVGSLLFIVVPVSTYFATRLLHGTKRASALGAIVAVASSLLWYRWALKYGTLGFITSAALLPLGFVLALRLADLAKQSSYKLATLAVLVLSLIVCWSLSAVVFAPLAAISLFYSFRLVRKPVILFVLAGLIVLNGPWLCVLWEVSSVGKLMSVEETGHTDSQGEQSVNVGYRNKRSPLSISLALKNLRDKASNAQPLILLFALPGLFFLTRFERFSFSATLLWLLFLGTFGVGLKPQLELDRMLVFAMLIASVPTGMFLSKTLDSIDSFGSIHRFLVSHAMAYAIVGLFAVAGILNNRSVERYSWYGTEQQALADRITELTPSGRALFSGFILHEFGGGHVAPLPLLTNVPMIASSPFHNKWKYTNSIPDEYVSKGDEGIEKFLFLHNVATVLAHEKIWRDYFLAHPEKYEYQGITSGFLIFTVKNFADSYVLEGSAKIVAQETDGVRIIPETSNVTLKFTYLPFLEAAPCTISNFQAGDEVNLVELHDCKPGKEVFLRAKNPIRRILEH